MLQTPTNNNNNPNQSTDFVSGLKQWWATCPLFTRFILFACAALCIFTHFNSKLPKSLVNKPQSIVNDYQVTRLIFSPFVFYTVVQAAIALIAYLPVSAQQEKENGTLKTIIDFFLKNLEISILFVAICYTIKSFYSNALYSEAYGLWSILFLQIVERCLQAPDETTAFFLPTFQLQNKYYPIVLFVLFTLVSDALRIDMIAAAVAAFINVKFLNAPYNEKFHHQKMVTWESNSAVAWLKTLPNFVSLTRGSEPLIADQGREYDPYAPVGASTSPTKRKKSSGSSPNSPYGDNGLINVNEMKPANKGKTDRNEFGVDI